MNWVEFVRGSFSKLPLRRPEASDSSGHIEDIRQIERLAADMEAAFKQAMIAQLEPRIEALLRSCPAPLAAKEEIRDFVNALTAAHGLAFYGHWKDDPTPTACSIHIMHSGRGDKSFFVLRERAKAPEHQFQRYSSHISSLEKIKLMIAPTREIVFPDVNIR